MVGQSSPDNTTHTSDELDSFIQTFFDEQPESLISTNICFPTEPVIIMYPTSSDGGQDHTTKMHLPSAGEKKGDRSLSLTNTSLVKFRSETAFLEDNSSDSKSESSQTSSLSSPVPKFNFVGNGAGIRLLTIIEGFNQPVEEKQIGGKDNVKHALPKQVIELHAHNLPEDSNPLVLSIKPVLMGGQEHGGRSRRVKEFEAEPVFQDKKTKKWIAVFDHLVVNVASHHHGQKLSVKFELLDADGKVVCSINSYPFETITRRGLGRRVEKASKSSASSEDEASDLKVESVCPSFGFVCGGDLVKITGSGFNSKCKVWFGNKEAREVIKISRDCIICETPDHMTGTVEVMVGFQHDVSTTAFTFQFFDPSSHFDMHHMAQLVLNDSKRNVKSPQQFVFK